MSNLSVAECAYLAGLFDGEGSVGYYYKTALRQYVPTVQISNSSPEIMEWLKVKLPFGTIAVTNNAKCRYTCWNWICSSKGRSKAFLQIIHPYLIFKKAQVDLLFDLWDTEEKAGCRPGKRVTDEMHALRASTRDQLKQLKTASYQLVTQNSSPSFGSTTPPGNQTPITREEYCNVR